MWFPRVKIKISNSLENKYYEFNKWIVLSKFKNKNIYFKYREDNIIEFVLDGYLTREEALTDGKILFFNILFAGYYSFLNFKMGDASYITKMFHEGHGYSVENFLKNEEWFYNTKKYSSNFLGLSIYEAENIKDLENYEDFSIKMWSIQDSEIDIFKYLQNIDYECIYNEKNQKIFHLFNLVEEGSAEIKILLLCQILETLAINKKRDKKIIDLLNDFKNQINLLSIDADEKKSICSGIENLKNISNKSKIDNLIKKYCKKKYSNFNIEKLIKDCYSLRSTIIHGGEIANQNEVFSNAYYLKILVLDIFKEWSKDNNE